MIPVWFGAMGVMIGFIFVVWVSKVHQKESGYARSVPQEKIFDLDLTHMHTSVNVIDIDYPYPHNNYYLAICCCYVIYIYLSILQF